MSCLKAKAQFAFEGDSSAGELSFREGEILTVVRQDVGEGWWEVILPSGRRGLAPGSYLQVVSTHAVPPPPTTRPRPPPPMPPALPSRPPINPAADGNFDPLSTSYNQTSNASVVSNSLANDDYLNLLDVFSTPPAPPQQPPKAPVNVAALCNNLGSLMLNSSNNSNNNAVSQNQKLSASWNAPATEASSSNNRSAALNASVNTGLAAASASAASRNVVADDDSFEDDSFDEDDSDYDRLSASDQRRFEGADGTGSTLTRQQSMSSMSTVSGMVEMAKSGAMRRGLSRAFVKLGGEAYLLGQFVSVKATDADRIQLIESAKGVIVWRSPTQVFSVTVSTPRKATKLRGLKTYTAYQLISSNSGLQVSRRYKQFDWLMNRLRDKFVFVCVPPLPDKQITGIYEEEFIKSRMKRLQLWMNRVTQHPLLSQSEILQHFITCTDEKRWKTGKRKAEKDELQGGRLFNAVDLSGVLSASTTSSGVTVVSGKPSFDVAVAESEMDAFDEQVRALDSACKQLNSVLHAAVKQQAAVANRVAKPFADAVSQLARSGFDASLARTVPGTDRLQSALSKTSNTYTEIAKLYTEQTSKDIEPLSDSLTEYHGLLSQLPEVTLLHRNTIAAVHECAYQYNDEQKLSEEDFTKICQRAQVMTTAVEAEANFFNYEKVRDFRDMLRGYLQQQALFHREVASKLEAALKEFS